MFVFTLVRHRSHGDTVRTVLREKQRKREFIRQIHNLMRVRSVSTIGGLPERN